METSQVPIGQTPLRLSPRPTSESFRVALVIPLSGPAGIFGPSCEACSRLAVEEVNAGSGILGRRLDVVVVDGGVAPSAVARQVANLVRSGSVEAIVGWHTSAVRQAVVGSVGGRVPYVYTALYEGGERTPGVFSIGEVPGFQLEPAIRWLRSELGVRRWAVVGNDYVWPRVTAAQAERYVRGVGGEVVDQSFVPLGRRDFAGVTARLERLQPDGVLMLLVGSDGVCFNRRFAAAGLDRSCIRMSTLMDENMLLATGVESVRGVFSAAGYFESLVTPESLDFCGRYSRRFGPEAPVLNSAGESCYEGFRLLAAMAERAGTVEVAGVCELSEGTVYAGARGELRLESQHARQRIYLAAAHGCDLSVVAQL